MIHVLGSLRFAIFILLFIAAACAAATFIESSQNAAAAQHFVYKAPWFTLSLGVLMLNLFSVTLTRWPWLPKHYGFVITHYGIIILLIGAILGEKLGFEGSVTLNKDQPTNRLVSRDRVLQITTLDRSFLVPFNMEVLQPSEQRPRTVRIPQSDHQLYINGFSEQLRQEPRLVEQPAGRPGVLLELSSPRLNDSRRLVLGAGEELTHDFGGMAKISLVDLDQFQSQEQEHSFWSETHMIFAAAPENAIVHVIEGPGSAYKALLHVQPDMRRLEIRTPDGSSRTYALEDVLEKRFNFGDVDIEVLEYFSTLDVVDGRPINIDEEDRNPALLLRLQGSGPATASTMLGLTVATPRPGSSSVPFQLLRGSEVVAQGELQQGQPIQTGWADWEVQLLQATASGEVASDWVEAVDGHHAETPLEVGLRMAVQSPSGEMGPLTWTIGGQSNLIGLDNTVVRVAMGFRMEPLDFHVTLRDFQVPRMEGSDRPADWISRLEFRGAEESDPVVTTVRMNHPGSYPAGLWGQISGQTFKFSQAEWNPDNLDETTLQVLFDPGWLFKWIGSVMICLGIGVMFVVTPKIRDAQSAKARPTDEEALEPASTHLQDSQ
ncbi:MAG: hypothetical protein ACFCU3_11505 [Verrucomicrobiales bacterium]